MTYVDRTNFTDQYFLPSQSYQTIYIEYSKDVSHSLHVLWVTYKGQMIALVATNDNETADILNAFSSVITRESETMDTIPSFVFRRTRNRFNKINLCIDQVWEQLCRLKPTKSCGSDNIYLYVLKEVKEGVVLPL